MNQLLMNHEFTSDVLGREELELYYEIEYEYRDLSPIELLAKQLMPFKETTLTSLFGGHIIKDDILIRDNIVVLYAPMKRSHIAQLSKDHPVALKLAVQRTMASYLNDDIQARLMVVNMSYDHKRRPREPLYQDKDIELYSNREIEDKIISHLSWVGHRGPFNCKKLDWYKDGGRNRRIKCELCPFNKQCKAFDIQHDAMQNILNI